MALTIQDVRQDFRPQRNYEWELSILPAGSPIGEEPLISQRIESHNIPSVENETIEINYKSQKTFHVGRDSSPHTFSVTLWDGEDGAIYRFFRNWRETGMSNSLFGGGLQRDVYATDAILRFYEHDSQTMTIAHRWGIVFPISVGEISANYSESSLVTFDVTFSYDWHLIGEDAGY